MSLSHFLYNHQKIWIFSWGLLTLTINNDKSRSMKKRIYVIKQRNIRSFHYSAFRKVFRKSCRPYLSLWVFKRVMKDYDYSALVTAHAMMIKRDDFYETVERKSFKTPDRNFSYQTIWHWSDYSSLLHLTKDQLPVTFILKIGVMSLALSSNRIRLSYLPTLSQENPKFKEHLVF